MIYFFLLNLIIIVIKKNCLTHRFNPTQPNPTHVSWIGLDKCDGLSWVEFFLTHHNELGQKISSTQPMHINGSTQKIFFVIYSLWVCMGTIYSHPITVTGYNLQMRLFNFLLKWLCYFTHKSQSIISVYLPCTPMRSK